MGGCGRLDGMRTPTSLTAVSFEGFPLDLLGKADTFIRLRPEHVLDSYGPVLTRFQAPDRVGSFLVTAPDEARREGFWEPRYGMEWIPVGPTRISVAELSTSLMEAERRFREEGPRRLEVTPEFVRALLR